MVCVRSVFGTLTIGCCEGGYNIVRYLYVYIDNVHYSPGVRNNDRNKKKNTIKYCTKTQLKLNVSREEYF